MTDLLGTLPEPSVTTEPEPTPDPVAGKIDGQGEDTGDDGDRTIDNVRGELVRKLDKQNESLTAALAAMQTQIASLATPAPAEPAAQPASVEDATSDQLIAVRDTLEAEDPRRAQFDTMIQEKRIAELVDVRVTQTTDRERREQLRRESNQFAVDRWPEITKPGTFRTEVNARLALTGTEAPDAVLAAANEVGLQKGLTPATAEPAMRGGGNSSIAGGHTTAPAGNDTDTSVSDTKLEGLAKSLANAMPDGKFDLDKVRKNAEAYARTK